MAHPDLDTEAAYLDAAADALAAMADRTTAAVAATEHAANEADAVVAEWHLRRRLSEMRTDGGLVAFGRIDEARERWYVGRRHIEDEAGEPLVVDWRAPVSIPFYRATAHAPLGLERRRRFMAAGDDLLDIAEEDFTDPDGDGLHGGIPDPLLAELDRERTATMRDIVATIAAEQDEIIRAPLDRLLVVQGGPGTGKTAVALHRVAFLLFEHRRALADHGALVIGPNPIFLRYVADVLPALGETDVRQTTVDGLRPSTVRLGLSDPDDVAAVKGGARMAQVVARAVRDGIRTPDVETVVHTDWGTVRLQALEVAGAVDEVLERDVPMATGRDALRNLLVHRAYDTHARTAEVPALKANFVDAARRDGDFRKVLDRIWPVPSAPVVVQRLLANRALRARCTDGILTPDERDLLERPSERRLADQRWSPADVPLLDEAEAQLTGVRHNYGHIVVDEAQDLSAMALRMLARRSATGSMTVVGDLAQSSRPWSQTSWDTVASILGGTAPVQRLELTVGYRTPAPILDFANALLPTAAPDVTPARSIRATGSPPQLLRTVDTVGAVVALVSDRDGPGTTAVIAVPASHRELADALDAAQVGWGRGAAGLGDLSLLTPLEAKGLEFDHVVVVEPSAIVAAEPAGERALYVALTRATQSLAVVHAHPLPESLGTPGPEVR